MRNFLISLACLSLVLGTWLGFNIYSSNVTSQCEQLSSNLIEQCLVDEDWQQATYTFRQLSEKWSQYTKVASYFLDAKDINEIDSTFQRAHLYIEAKDESNASGEISYIKKKISLLHKNESPVLSNIF